VTLRVAYVVDEWIALSQTFIRSEVAELRRQGADIDVVALRRGSEPPRDDEPAVYLPELVAATVPGRLRQLGRHPVRAAELLRTQSRSRSVRIPYRAALPSLAEELRAGGTKWVHAHFAWEAASVAHALAALLGVGWSLTAHANDIFVSNPHLCDRLGHADRLVTVCRYNEEFLRSTCGALPPTEIVVCGVEVPPAVQRPAGEGAPVDILAVGRLVPKKGFDVLIHAVSKLRDRSDLRVEIVGDGPEGATLDGLVRDLSLSDCVHLCGPRPHEWVLQRMTEARAVCLPARVAADGDRDSMPVVLKEAMARGVPVVTTDVGGIPELVDDSVGRLVPPDDVGALARALDELLGDDVVAARLGAAGRQRIVDRFTLSGEVGRLRSHFERWSASRSA